MHDLDAGQDFQTLSTALLAPCHIGLVHMSIYATAVPGCVPTLQQLCLHAACLRNLSRLQQISANCRQGCNCMQGWLHEEGMSSAIAAAMMSMWCKRPGPLTDEYCPCAGGMPQVTHVSSPAAGHVEAGQVRQHWQRRQQQATQLTQYLLNTVLVWCRPMPLLLPWSDALWSNTAATAGAANVGLRRLTCVM